MDSSSRRSAIEALLVLPFVAGSELGCRPAPPAAEPVLVVSDGAPAPAGPPDAAAVRLALSSLSGETVAELADLLDETLTALEARGNPLLIDLLGSEHQARWRASAAWLLPVVNAARSFVRGSWAASDGWSVRVERPGTSPGARAIPAWAAGDDGDRTVLRARFLAWPVTRARLLRAPDPQVRAQVAARLSKELPRAETLTGLVLDLAALEGTRRFDALEQLLREKRTLLKRAGGDSIIADLATVGDRNDPRRTATWLDLSARELLVVPRLSALARDREFEQGLMRLAHTVDARVTIVNRRFD